MGKKAFQSPFTVGSNYAINGSVIRILNLTKRESIIKKKGSNFDHRTKKKKKQDK
jgi:hypothetical protein